MEKLSGRFHIYHEAYKRLEKILSPLSSEERQQLVRSSLLLQLLPFPDLEKFISTHKLITNNITENLKCFSLGIDVAEIAIDALEKSNQITNKDRTGKVETKRVPSPEVREPSFTLFQNDAAYLPCNITNKCKEEAREKIDKETAKETARKNRNPKPQKSAPQVIENKVEEEDLILYRLSQQGEISQVKAFPLKNTIELYLSCDGDILPGDKFKWFQDVGLKGKKLIRKSLGQNGIKVYGHYGLYIKCKKCPGDHLLFHSYPIVGEEGYVDGYVYLPKEIISHTKCDKWIPDPAFLRKHSETHKEFIAVSFSHKLLEQMREELADISKVQIKLS
jgi:hypothetical protein